MLCGCFLEILNKLSLNLYFKWSLRWQRGMFLGFRTSYHTWLHLQLPPWDGFLATCYQPFGARKLACSLLPSPHPMSPSAPKGTWIWIKRGLVLLPAALWAGHSGGHPLPGLKVPQYVCQVTLQWQTSHPPWIQVPYWKHPSMELATPWGLRVCDVLEQWTFSQPTEGGTKLQVTCIPCWPPNTCEGVHTPWISPCWRERTIN